MNEYAVVRACMYVYVHKRMYTSAHQVLLEASRLYAYAPRLYAYAPRLYAYAPRLYASLAGSTTSICLCTTSICLCTTCICLCMRLSVCSRTNYVCRSGHCACSKTINAKEQTHISTCEYAHVCIRAAVYVHMQAGVVVLLLHFKAKCAIPDDIERASIKSHVTSNVHLSSHT
jgi:hypothetical protein